MKVWTYICEDCGWETTFAEDEPTEECWECYGDMLNQNDEHEE
jgi:predicted nucleic acid-binding Zn ribbon protein